MGLLLLLLFILFFLFSFFFFLFFFLFFFPLSVSSFLTQLFSVSLSLFLGAMPLIERTSHSKNENLKLACCMALYNLKLSFVHLKDHKEVREDRSREREREREKRIKEPQLTVLYHSLFWSRK